MGGGILEPGVWQLEVYSANLHEALSIVGAVRDIGETYEYDMISALKGLPCLMRKNQ